jgi:ATP-binding cassette subfamily B protein
MEKNLWAEFRSIAIRYRKEYALAFGMVLLGNSLLILNPLLLRQALEALDPSIALSEGMMASFLRKITHWALGNYITSLPIWVILLTSTALLGAYLKYSMRLSFVAISRRVERNTRGLIFERIQSHTLEFFDKHRIGDLMSRLTNDISVYRCIRAILLR